MTATIRGLALALVLLCPLGAEANGFRSRPVATSYYYYPSYYYPSYYYPSYYPAYVPAYAPVVMPTPGFVPAPAPVYATPTPAPPCPPPAATPSPAVTPPPAVRESQSNYPTTARSVSTTAKVSFWNYSGRDVKLRVDGETRTIAAGRGLTLELPRDFVWQVDERTPETERVPSREPALEIVIRR